MPIKNDEIDTQIHNFVTSLRLNREIDPTYCQYASYLSAPEMRASKNDNGREVDIPIHANEIAAFIPAFMPHNEATPMPITGDNAITIVNM